MWEGKARGLSGIADLRCENFKYKLIFNPVSFQFEQVLTWVGDDESKIQPTSQSDGQTTG